MGRFASTVRYYERYREPYPAAFFQALAERLRLTGRERLVDAACGPAPLAIGLRPFVGSCIGVDPEARMIAAASAAAVQAGISIDLRRGRFEEVGPNLGTIDVVTIGRALQWLPHDRTIAVLEKAMAANGAIVVCASLTSNASINRWRDSYRGVLRAWSRELRDRRYRTRPEVFFRGTRFRKTGQMTTTLRRRVKVTDLIGRALSFSTNSPTALGKKRKGFEQALRDALTPFASDGVLFEEILAGAVIFQ